MLNYDTIIISFFPRIAVQVASPVEDRLVYKGISAAAVASGCVSFVCEVVCRLLVFCLLCLHERLQNKAIVCDNTVTPRYRSTITFEQTIKTNLHTGLR